jgi:CheY-like chemotaxis protein
MRAGPDIGELVRGSGEKVLIVDDEVDILETFEILLTEGLGYRAASANNAEAAIDKYKTWRPDAVLLDRNMRRWAG